MVKYIEGIHINEMEIDERFERYLDEGKYIVFAYSYGTLYNKHGSLGHVALVKQVVRDGIIQIYDPGPDGAGEKEVSVSKMYDAMRVKGGIYIFNVST